ncbi:C-type lectin LmsL-like [Siphateles boraxobius]|uniref:C-type lectin LmsL-like n=1 Tax=Siphateles boraxobius TaxID=180520 RepID=UPI0040641BB2
MMRIDLIFVLLSALNSSVNSRVFYIIPERMSWSEAQTYCRQKHTDLATLDDQADIAELKTFPKFKENMWIGLYQQTGTSPWIWSDQSKSVFRLWASKQPNNYGGIQFCVYISPDGSWNDWDCLEKMPFICYDMKRQIVRFEVKSSQILILNDPELKKKILAKIEQTLKEEGLTEEAKLSWNLISGENVFQRMWYQKNEVSQTPCRRIRN